MLINCKSSYHSDYVFVYTLSLPIITHYYLLLPIITHYYIYIYIYIYNIFIYIYMPKRIQNYLYTYRHYYDI